MEEVFPGEVSGDCKMVAVGDKYKSRGKTIEVTLVTPEKIRLERSSGKYSIDFTPEQFERWTQLESVEKV